MVRSCEMPDASDSFDRSIGRARHVEYHELLTFNATMYHRRTVTRRRLVEQTRLDISRFTMTIKIGINEILTKRATYLS